jgi:hypothetical protein
MRGAKIRTTLRPVLPARLRNRRRSKIGLEREAMLITFAPKTSGSSKSKPNSKRLIGKSFTWGISLARVNGW